jgi:mRNA interferase MazF
MKSGESMTYIPDSGDIVWLQFDPQSGHEQRGHRPALVLSPKAYNEKVGLAIFCPITSQIKGYPFEVVIPEGIEVKGAVLSDQVKSLDWKARNATIICKLPVDKFDEVIKKLKTLLNNN